MGGICHTIKLGNKKYKTANYIHTSKKADQNLSNQRKNVFLIKIFLYRRIRTVYLENNDVVEMQSQLY